MYKNISVRLSAQTCSIEYTMRTWNMGHLFLSLSSYSRCLLSYLSLLYVLLFSKSSTNNVSTYLIYGWAYIIRSFTLLVLSYSFLHKHVFRPQAFFKTSTLQFFISSFGPTTSLVNMSMYSFKLSFSSCGGCWWSRPSSLVDTFGL